MGGVNSSRDTDTDTVHSAQNYQTLEADDCETDSSGENEAKVQASKVYDVEYDIDGGKEEERPPQDSGFGKELSSADNSDTDAYDKVMVSSANLPVENIVESPGSGSTCSRSPPSPQPGLSPTLGDQVFLENNLEPRYLQDPHSVTNGKLSRSMKMHTRGRLQCGSCNKGVIPTSHMEIHTGQRPYGCDMCGKSFVFRRHGFDPGNQCYQGVTHGTEFTCP